MTPDSLFTLIMNCFRKGEYYPLFLTVKEINNFEILEDVDVVCRKPECRGKMYKTEKDKNFEI